MIFQNPHAALNPIRQLGRQIADVLLRHGGATRADAKGRAIKALRAVGIPDLARRTKAYPFELSGGMCQRVVIVIAVAARPELLIADEPTTGLDVTTQAVVMDLIGAIAAETGMATFLITHDLALAAERAGRIAVMHAGHVVEIAPTATLIARPMHPYSARLLAATPTTAGSLDALQSVPGGLPDLRAAVIPACRYAARRGAVRSANGGVRTAAGDAGTGARPRRCLLAAAGSGGMRTILELENVSKCFPSGWRDWLRGTPPSFVHAVDQVHFTVGEGETVGLVGESGCGKSTLVRLITRLLDVTDGTIWFHRRALSEVPARELLGRFPHQLSGGQRARVGIARAIGTRPRLLVLDEPTAELDVSVQVTMLKLLRQLKAELGLLYQLL